MKASFANTGVTGGSLLGFKFCVTRKNEKGEEKWSTKASGHYQPINQIY